MEALKITATLRGLISMRDYVHLDALLAYAVCLRDGIPMATREDELVDVEIPVARHQRGFHLASVGVFDWEFRERAYLNRRFPVEEAIRRTRMKRVNLAAGAQKHFRIPYERGALVGDEIRFYCVGDRAQVSGLISLITHLGARRATGNGHVKRWEIATAEGWDGFPILSPEGEPLRHLPEGFPGVERGGARYGNLTYPYWRRSTEEVVLCP